MNTRNITIKIPDEFDAEKEALVKEMAIAEIQNQLRRGVVVPAGTIQAIEAKINQIRQANK